MYKFIFDVDGTLNPSREKIDKEFAVWFSKFCEHNHVYLVTGSDRSKTIEQLGEYIYCTCKRVYNCAGNDVYHCDRKIRTTDWTLPPAAYQWLDDQLSASKFPLRTGLHFENRPGMVNFSVVGRNARLAERRLYIQWDLTHDERDYIAYNFNLIFTDLEARPGGETGIDIAPRGADKSQILQDFDNSDFIVFFGDRMDEGGNDYPLSTALSKNYQGVNHWVQDWKETWTILKNEYSVLI